MPKNVIMAVKFMSHDFGQVEQSKSKHKVLVLILVLSKRRTRLPLCFSLISEGFFIFSFV
jgi:hypothetical protein